MKIVSVMTTSSAGGGEFAAVEMLEALRHRGHDVVMISDSPSIGRDTEVPVRSIALGPKLAKGTWVSLMLRWPQLLWRLRRALRAELPYDVLIVHYKKEQLLAAMLPKRLRSTIVWAEWGKVPFQFHTGIPHAAYLAAARRAGLVMCVSQGTHDSVVEQGVDADKVIVVPNVLRTDDISYSEQGRASVRASLGIPADAFVVGCISRFHPKKRNDVLVTAVRELDDPRVHLILAGDGETEQQLRALAAPLGERAHFVATPGNDVADVLSAFDVVGLLPEPHRGGAASGDPRHARLEGMPVDGSRGGRRHDHARHGRDRLSGERSGRDARAAPAVHRRPRARQAGGRGGTRARRAEVRSTGRRRDDRGPVRRGAGPRRRSSLSAASTGATSGSAFGLPERPQRLAVRDRLGQRGAPRRRVERVGEELRLVLHLATLELHDADRVGGHAVVGDHAFADPEIAAAEDPPNCEVPLRRMPAALRFDLRPAGETLARLGIVEDRIVGVDRVLRHGVSALGGGPVLEQARAEVVHDQLSADIAISPRISTSSPNSKRSSPSASVSGPASATIPGKRSGGNEAK